LLQDNDILEDYLVLTLNKAIEKATTINQTELASAVKEGIPNIHSLVMFK